MRILLLISLISTQLYAVEPLDLTDLQRAHEILLKAQAIVEGRYFGDGEDNLTAVNFWDDSLAKKLAKSKRILAALRKKVHVAVVVPVYKELNRMRTKSEHQNGEDFIREKIRQLDWFSDCPHFSWDIIIVDDGCPENSGDEAIKIVEAFSNESSTQWPVKVLFLKDGIEHKRTPAISNLQSTDESKKGGSIYYGLATALRSDVSGEHIVLYTDADLSAHLGQVGFAVDQIVNQGYGVSIGSRKLEIASTSGANTKGGKLWCYFWSNLFPHLQVTDTQVGFKAFHAKVLGKILAQPMTEHGLCFDVEILVKAQQPIGEFPLIWIHSLAESKVKKTQEKNLLDMLQSLGRIYADYGVKTPTSDEFARLVSTLTLEELNAIFDACPKDIWSASYAQLRAYKRYSAGDVRKWGNDKRSL